MMINENIKANKNKKSNRNRNCCLLFLPNIDSDITSNLIIKFSIDSPQKCKKNSHKDAEFYFPENVGDEK